MKNNENAVELGKRIRKAREEAKLTQYQLHDKTGISITQISAYENGNRNIGLQSLYKIAKATNKTMDEIYGGPKEARPIMSASNKGELIVNCVAALVDEGVITCLAKEQPNDFVPMGTEYYFQIGFNNYVHYLDKMVKKLVDFNNDIDNYPDPENFKKQILAATVKQINSSER